MAIVPGLVVMPTVLINTALSFFKDRSYKILSNDSLAVISPMYNEEKGGGLALDSLLLQERVPEHIAISINGSTDNTYKVVTNVLKKRKFDFRGTTAITRFNAILETWTSKEFKTRVNILVYYRQVSKSESINNLLESKIVDADRILIVDGDTIFHKSFVKRLRENFYRLHKKGKRYWIEDYGLQSGSVGSIVADDAGFDAHFISAARTAEYAFSSIIREGQAKQIGNNKLFGNSRLYTVIGCGFVARRDLLPMPVDTETEDHDFSLSCQSRPSKTEMVNIKELESQGFRIIKQGQEYTPTEFLQEDEIELKHSGNARFIPEALMSTEDPPHLSGFVRQVERWNGGGLQNVLKRLARPLSINVFFTLWGSFAEAVVGLFLLALLPTLLALNSGNPSLGIAPLSLGAWLGFDLIISFSLISLGLFKRFRAEGSSPIYAFFKALGNSFKSLLPFLFLRWLNPVTYVASATRVFPEHIRSRRQNYRRRGITWEKAHTRGLRASRSKIVLIWTSLFTVASTFGVAHLAPYINPINYEAWRLVYNKPHVDLEDFDYLPSLTAGADEQALSALSYSSIQSSLPPIPKDSISIFCHPSFTRLNNPKQSLAQFGKPSEYTPLGFWGLLTLARAVPLMPYIENAANSYNVPLDLLLMIFINESDLNPLADGTTGDKGLSQITSDALTLLNSISRDKESIFYNPRLFPKTYSVYDPDFSSCAGAAKIAWALNQESADSRAKAYALYINPIHGLVNGEISQRHKKLVNHMMSYKLMVKQIANAYALYETNPNYLSKFERKLIKTSYALRDKSISIEEAYQKTFNLVKIYGLNDREVFETILANYFAKN